MTNDEQREAFEALFGKRHKYHTTREWDTALTAWYAATAAERERCAKVCDFMAKLGAEDRMHGAVVVATELAAAIRKG